MQIEGKTSKADIVLGLDTNLMSVAKETGLFAPHNVDVSSKVNLPESVQGKWEDNLFVPFDWGYFAFIYDTTLCPKCASKKVFAKGTASTYGRR